MTQKKKKFSVFFRVFLWLISGMMTDTRYSLYEKSPYQAQPLIHTALHSPFHDPRPLVIAGRH